jgi:hypothetical protein
MRLRSLNVSTSDNGKKLGKLICRVEKELDRRHAAGVSKCRILAYCFVGSFLDLPYTC